MDDLPKGWILSKLGDLGEWSSGGTPSRKNSEYYGGSIPWVKTGDLNDNYIDLTEEFITEIGLKNSSAKIFPSGTLLLAMYGATIGKTGILKFDAATNQACAAILAKGLTTQIIHFLRFFLIYKASDFKEIGQGGAQPNISQTIIKQFPIPIPPLAEQKRIVTKLDSLFAHTRRAREELDRIPKLIERYKQAILSAAFRGDLIADWRKENKYNEKQNLTSIGDIALSLSYGSSAKSSKTGSIPVLRMGNIQDGKLDWNDLVFTSNIDEIEKYKLLDGDVLFNRTNSPELVGKTAVYKNEKPAIYAGYLIRIRCKPEIMPDYLNYCLNSPEGRNYCFQVKSDGVSQSNINAKKLAAFTFHLPTIEEQKEIVKRVENYFQAIDRLEQEYQKAIKLCDRLEQSTLAKAFRGELVSQDPNDEPASILLERIQKERETQKSPKKKAKKIG